LSTGAHPLFTCCAESDDGIAWRKPKLGLHDSHGSKDNSIVLASGKIGKTNAEAGHPAVFRDETPDAPADARYKALIRSNGPHGLLAFKSADHAPMAGGELVTRPVRFDGAKLALNFATSAAGAVRVELQDAAGKLLPGFALDACPPVFGDSVDRVIGWNGQPDLAKVAGRQVRVRFALNDAHVYAFQFCL
jgi:hypothetical protein